MNEEYLREKIKRLEERVKELEDELSEVQLDLTSVISTGHDESCRAARAEAEILAAYDECAEITKSYFSCEEIAEGIYYEVLAAKAIRENGK